MLNLYTTDHPECVHGFISGAAFEHVMAATELFSSDDELRFSALKFNCPSPITKWTIGAKIAQQQASPRILIGNLRTNNSFVLNPLNTTSYINVYEHEPNNLPFISVGDYISIKSSQIYYQRCALGDCEARPLVAVDTGEFRVLLHHVIDYFLTDCKFCNVCTCGFIGLDELREKARYIPNFVNVSDQTLHFQHMKITQDGYIVKWTFTAEKNHLTSNYSWMEYPQLVILSSNYNPSITTDSDYVVYSTDSSQANNTPYPNVYEVTIPSVPVSVGDYIAVYQPDYNKAGMLLKFVNIPPLERQEIKDSSTFRPKPLIHLEIG